MSTTQAARRPRLTGRGRAALTAAALGLTVGLSACAEQSTDVTVGLITKQEENPYWVEMREVAQETADDHDIEVLTATGSSDVDVTGQQEAMTRMVQDGVDGILIAPTDSTALAGAIDQARAAGVIVIAVDTPVEPLDSVDAYFATDNRRAGELIGRYAKAKVDQLGLDPRIAMLDLAPGISSGEQRHEGFLEGFGLAPDASAIVAQTDTQGDRENGEAAMSQALSTHPDINVVYTVNERAALGAVEALKAAGKDLGQVVVVSVDGGCEAIKDALRPGDIDATAQQYPQNMAREGVFAIADAVREGQRPSGYLDTGVQLVTGDPAPGVDSRNIAYGVRNCWG